MMFVRPCSKPYRSRFPTVALSVQVLLTGLFCASCAERADNGEDPNVTTLGSAEVTAQLAEIPGEFPSNKLYDYAFVLKYKVTAVHRGRFDSDTIYVGHYNPRKSRSAAADKRVEDVGGNLGKFRAGELHRMALETSIDEYYMGGIVNEYFGEDTGPIYWAVWTNRVIEP